MVFLLALNKVRANKKVFNIYIYISYFLGGGGKGLSWHWFLKKNLSASRPSEHPPVRGGNIKTFKWDHRLQRPNLFMAFKRVP